MGKWADTASRRFDETADDERRAEELELQRHAKMVAGAEKLWDKLTRFIKTETSDFNHKKEREFFEVSDIGNEVEIAAPKLRLKLELDLRTPSIDFTYYEPYANREEKDAGEYHFRLNNGDVLLVGQYDKETPLSIETVGGELLDRLVV